MADANGLIATLSATFVGSGAGTTLVGSLFKHRFDVQLEPQKAFLQRHSKTHERQMDALLAIHSDREHARFTCSELPVQEDSAVKQTIKHNSNASVKNLPVQPS